MKPTLTTTSSKAKMDSPTQKTDPKVGSVVMSMNVRNWLRSPAAKRYAHERCLRVSQPREVAHFSRDNNRHVKHGSREQLGKYIDPPLHVNLGDMYESFVPKDHSEVGFEPILESLLSQSFNIDGQEYIITYRNNLNKIGLTPYSRDEWELDCAQVGNAIVLDIRKTRAEPTDADQLLSMYYGYRFEALCTGQAAQPVNANSEFCSVVETKIGNHKILLSSEIDCTEQVEHGTDPLQGYVELKTVKEIKEGRLIYSLHRHRFLKFWLQSYLGGVVNIVLGQRSANGQLTKVERLRTSDLPRMSREYMDYINDSRKWEPIVCINFLECTLDMIRKTCRDNVGSTIRVRHEPSTSSITCSIVASAGEELSKRITDVLRKTST